jgi:NADH-ubiquinone oxidoreductase chain 1
VQVFLVSYSCFVLFFKYRTLLFLLYVKLVFISVLFIWVGGTVPLFRYDKLMYLAWRRFLPLSLNCLLYFVGVKCFIFFFVLVY